MARPSLDPVCPACGGTELYMSVKPIASGGGHAPDLLPGLHPWYGGGRLRAGCGLHRQFAEPAAQERLRASPKWRRL